jgi:hypothetical protein
MGRREDLCGSHFTSGWDHGSNREQSSETEMIEVRRQTLSLFVDRSSQQWVVRDEEGNYWVLPPTTKPWDDRQPFYPAEETELESVPGHYKNLLGVPSQSMSFI